MMVGEKRAQVIKDFCFKHEDDPCKCCGQSKVLMINRKVCKDCNNLALRQKVTCKTCDKELTKGSYNNHHKMCERIRCSGMKNSFGAIAVGECLGLNI